MSEATESVTKKTSQSADAFLLGKTMLFRRGVILSMALVVSIGAIVIWRTRASSVYRSLQPELGHPSGPITIASDSSASGHQYIKFGAAGCPAGQVGSPPNCDYPRVGYYSNIPSDFDINAYIVGGWGVPNSTAGPPSSGAFRIVCKFSHLAYNDPIVYPGMTGAAHLHMFFGNTTADASSDYPSLRSNGSGTCNGNKDNRSAYWAPALINASNKVVIPNDIIVYYKAEGLGGNETPQTIAAVHRMPMGLRMVAGQNSSGTNPNPQNFWYCENDGNTHYATIPSCPGTNPANGKPWEVYMRQVFPSCWNGSYLDSADHRSHMAYIYYNNGVPQCPTGYPIRVPEVTYLVGYANDGNASNWHLSSDRMPGGHVFANGGSLHADWFGAWDENIVTQFMNGCVYGMKSCSGGQLGDDRRLSDAVTPYTGPMIVDIPPNNM